MQILLLKLLFLLMFLTFTISYTTYQPQQSQKIKQQQSQKWQQSALSFHASQTNTFILQTRLYFYIYSKQSPQQNLKMRGRAYFVQYDQNGKRRYIQIKQLSPFDVTKIYVYSENGIIVKSEQFYTSFVFQVGFKQNQKYQIVFIDGPPGPPKLIQWQIDYQILSIPQLQQTKTIKSDMALFSLRLSSLSQFITQSSHYTGLSSIQQKLNSQYLLKSMSYYRMYTLIESFFVLIVMLLQIWAMKRVLRKDNIVLV